MNDFYFIKINDIKTSTLRKNDSFDELILKFIKKYENENLNIDLLATFIALAIDYPKQAIINLLNEYKLNNMIDNNLKVIDFDKKIIERKENINLRFNLNILYNINTKEIVEINKSDLAYSQIENLKLPKTKIDLEKAKAIIYVYSYLKETTKTKNSKLKYNTDLTDLSYLILELKKQYKNKNIDNLEILMDNVEIIGPITNKEISQKYFNKSKLPKIMKDKIRKYYLPNEQKYISPIYDKLFKNETLYYDIGLATKTNKNYKLEIMDIIAEIISNAKESVYILSTKNPTSKDNANVVSEAFNKLDKKIHKRFITGLTEKNNKKIDIEYDEENNLYGEVFPGGIHSKIIIIDNEFVILGSGNWFSSNSNFDDSFVLLYQNNPLDRYNSLYSKDSDYYDMINNKINEIDDFKQVLNYYTIISYDLINNNHITINDDLRNNIIDKILNLVVKDYNKYKDIIIDILNDNKYPEWLKKLLKEQLINKLSKREINELLKQLGDD